MKVSSVQNQSMHVCLTQYLQFRSGLLFVCCCKYGGLKKRSFVSTMALVLSHVTMHLFTTYVV